MCHISVFSPQPKRQNFLNGVPVYVFHFVFNICHFLCRELILKGPGVLLGMVVLQRGLSCQAAVRAPLVSLVRTAQAGWSQAVVACQQPKEFNLGSSPKQRLSPALLQPQEAVAKTHFEALNSSRLAQERGNKMVKPSGKSQVLVLKVSKSLFVAIKRWATHHGFHMSLLSSLYMCIHCWVPFTVEKFNEVSRQDKNSFLSLSATLAT